MAAPAIIGQAVIGESRIGVVETPIAPSVTFAAPDNGPTAFPAIAPSDAFPAPDETPATFSAGDPA